MLFKHALRGLGRAPRLYRRLGHITVAPGEDAGLLKRPATILVLWALLGAAAPSAAQATFDGDLPRWLQFSVESRGRFEGSTGIGYEPGGNDAYFLHRLQLDTTVLATDWMRFFVRVQDSREAGRREPVPGKVQDPFDIRGAYAEFGKPPGDGWRVRVGRQILAYGGQRLVGPGGWSNVPRVFDAAVVSYQNRRARLDWFVSSRAQPDGETFDNFSTDDRLAGFYSSFPKLLRSSTVEPYFLLKGARNERSESGALGDKNVYTGGVRITGPLARGFDYTAEAAFQGGTQVGGRLCAWATNLVLGHTLRAANRGARLFVEYDHASGDDDPHDGRHNTFDQLFPTNHGKYGIVDKMGWRNMHGIRGGLSLRLHQRWTLNLDYHSFWLASRNDYLYRSNGAPVARNPDATSSHAFQEVDVQNVVMVRKELNLLFGYAHLFPGRFLKESTPGSPVTYAYLAWQMRL